MRARTVIVGAVVVVAAAVFVVEIFTKGPLAFAGGHTVALADYHEADPTGVPQNLAKADQVKRGEYLARAADCLRQANSLTLEINRKQKREYIAIEHERFVDRIESAFGPEFFAHTGRAGADTRQPVFIFGLPRSGTTPRSSPHRSRGLPSG